jgi:hypothetical protein
MTAIAIAMDRAGIRADAEFAIAEIPKHKGLFGFSLPLLPVRRETTADPVLDYLQKLCDEPLQPVYMMLPGTYPTLED